MESNERYARALESSKKIQITKMAHLEWKFIAGMTGDL